MQMHTRIHAQATEWYLRACRWTKPLPPRTFRRSHSGTNVLPQERPRALGRCYTVSAAAQLLPYHKEEVLGYILISRRSTTPPSRPQPPCKTGQLLHQRGQLLPLGGCSKPGLTSNNWYFLRFCQCNVNTRQQQQQQQKQHHLTTHYMRVLSFTSHSIFITIAFDNNKALHNVNGYPFTSHC